MLMVYIVIGWSLLGCIAALLMGRAIALTADRRRPTLHVAADATRPTAVVEPAKAA